MKITRTDLTKEEQKLWDIINKNREQLSELELQLEVVIDRHKSEKIGKLIGKTYQDTCGQYIMVIGYENMCIQVVELMSDFVIHITDIHSLDLYTEIPKNEFLDRYHKVLAFFSNKIGE